MIGSMSMVFVWNLSQFIVMLKGAKLCDERYEIGEIFSSSNFKIYRIHDHPNLIVKVYPIEYWINVDYVENEAYFWRRASELGVAPRYISHSICPDFIDKKTYGFLIVEKYGKGSLTDLIVSGLYDEYKEIIDKLLRHILDILYENNIDQNDLHSNNFLFDIVDSKIEIKIIDFDSAQALGTRKRNYRIRVIGRDGRETDQIIDLTGIEGGKRRNYKKRQ